MKIAMICGHWSTQLHGKINVDELYEHRALTGSESSFFNLARGLSEIGHHVDVYCDATHPIDKCAKLSGARVIHINNDPGAHYDVYFSINEPDQFRRIPSNATGLRILHQQLNDFGYCQPGWEHFVDILAFVTPVHRDNIAHMAPGMSKEAITWVPNSLNIEFSQQFRDLPRVPRSMTWCSSPDRGLHHLLDIFPQIRKEVPEATLKIYYRFQPWYDQIVNTTLPTAEVAKSIEASLQKLGRNGENGVTLVGPVPNVEMAKVLAQTEIMPYTCDCATFTEGFSVSTLDACAAGTVPIISDTDAIGDTYRDVAVILPPHPAQHKETWVKTIVGLMKNDEERRSITRNAREFAQTFSRQKVAKQWEALMLRNLKTRETPTFDHMPLNIREYLARHSYHGKGGGTTRSPRTIQPSLENLGILPAQLQENTALTDALLRVNIPEWIVASCLCEARKPSCSICKDREAKAKACLHAWSRPNPNSTPEAPQ